MLSWVRAKSTIDIAYINHSELAISEIDILFSVWYHCTIFNAYRLTVIRLKLLDQIFKFFWVLY